MMMALMPAVFVNVDRVRQHCRTSGPPTMNGVVSPSEPAERLMC
ncbi:hypothetical protein SAMN05421805_10631 [Saccharopolyspora antimicrobica]|uniref:Uncharacterized protein n=1 Tax=Saccharopolyspora antimicrobica TaxID=455193 RepID=A0A1I5AWL2_9PSEU|nr:hypothetical protein [Saccharopolyspora antimicrobica]RKT86390.1 hypothetical protein ATL45_4756 [Saccharopolyspora antimicrobica]SFN66834.1 hypothetical protein SAMN05421805_10631 [Saccharopolyspora antimicrobica]